MADRRLEVILSLKDKFSKGMAASQSKLEKFSGTAKKAGVAITAIGVAGAVALGKFIASSKEQEIGISRLNQSLKNVGTSYAANEAQIEKNIDAIQRKTNFGDEMQRDALQKLVTIGGKWEGALDALSVTTDVAAGANIDLNAAALLVGKAIAGETSSLSRYGIKIKEGATQTEIMIALTKQFGGAAEAASDPLVQMKNRLGDTAQVIGDQLLPFVDAVAIEIEKMADWVNNLNPSLIKWVAIAAGVAVALALIIGPMLLMIGFLPVLIASFVSLGLAMSAALLGIPILIALIVAGAILMMKNWDTVKMAVETAINFILGLLSKYVNAHIKVANAIIAVGDAVAKFFGRSIEPIEEVNFAIDITDEKIRGVAATAKDKMAAIDRAVLSASGSFDDTTESVDELAESIEDTAAVAKAFADNFMEKFEADTALRKDIRDQETAHILRQNVIRASEEAKAFALAMEYANEFMRQQEENAEKRKIIREQETDSVLRNLENQAAGRASNATEEDELSQQMHAKMNMLEEDNAARAKATNIYRSTLTKERIDREMDYEEDAAQDKVILEANTLKRIAHLQGVVNERAEAFLASLIPTIATRSESEQSLVAKLAAANQERLARIEEINKQLAAGGFGGGNKQAILEAELARLVAQSSVAGSIGEELASGALPGFGGAPLPIQEVVAAGIASHIINVVAPNLTDLNNLNNVAVVSQVEAARVSDQSFSGLNVARASNF
jgi:hypothetical protein